MNERTAWERLQLIRNPARPTVRDYIPRIFTEFLELQTGCSETTVLCLGASADWTALR